MSRRSRSSGSSASSASSSRGRAGRRGRAADAEPEGIVPGVHAISHGTAEIREDPYEPGAFVLYVNGVESSPLDPDHPERMGFEYMRWAAAAVRAHWPDPVPLRALHLGGAGCALARWVDHAHPGSHQTAVEIDAGLAALARERFGLPRAPALRIRVADAAHVLATARPASRDLVIRDVFAPDPADLTGARHITPPALTGLAAAQAAARVLAPGGLYVLNVGGGPDLGTVRADVAAVVAAFEHVEVIADPPMLKGRRRGNVIVAASDVPVARSAADAPAGADPRDALARALRTDAFPVRLAEDPRGFPAGVPAGQTGLRPPPAA